VGASAPTTYNFSVDLLEVIMQYARTLGGVATIAALGDSQATAAAVTAGLTVVNAATGTTADGIRLPAGWGVGETITIVNTTAVALDVFPPTGGAINGGSANAAKALAANMGGKYISLGGGNWGAVLSA
jgi:hypothetical protein